MLKKGIQVRVSQIKILFVGELIFHKFSWLRN